MVSRYAVRSDGEEIRSEAGEVKVRASAMSLGQNFPNPFNPITLIEYVLPSDGEVSLAVYDGRGRRVRTLVEGRQADGRKRVEWDGRDDSGREVASGVYFYRLETPAGTLSRKMTLLR